jgi:RNA polymerase sigma-70 factor (ECF subfamily)
MGKSPPGQRFEDFIREYGERAFQFAYRLSGNVEEAKDLVQEACRRALSRWHHFDEQRSLDAWFFTILRHLFLDGRRSAARRRNLSLDASVPGDVEQTYSDLLPGEEEAALEQLARAETAEQVRRVLDALSYDHKVILTLCDMQALRYEEISQVLDVPVGTVRSRLSRARIAFRRALLADSRRVS